MSRPMGWQSDVTIFFVQLLYLQVELAVFNDVVVKLVPTRECCKFGAWKTGKRGKVKSV